MRRTPPPAATPRWWQLMPRLSMTGLPASPTAASSVKFCALRVPTCSMSAYDATSSTSCASTTSVTIGRPVSSRTSARICRPCSPSPWNAYGEDRGLNAPPRSRVAPAAAAICAACSVWSAVSTAQGPAIRVKVSGPIGTRAAPTCTVDGVWCSRETSLYGVDTRTTSMTPDSAMRFRPWNLSMSPTRPTTVRDSPRLTNASPPAPSTRSTTCATSDSVASAVMTTTMGAPQARPGRPGRSPS